MALYQNVRTNFVKYLNINDTELYLHLMSIKHMYKNEYETNIFLLFNNYFSMKTDDEQLAIVNIGEYLTYKVSILYVHCA